ncbi:MAG: hypothetical protein K5910_07630 [Bacteroidales bacterium]|nr:hypothetical protein [Bacteroidales bacterium]
MTNKGQGGGETVCLECGKTFFGRKDKQFCSIACKNRYHNRKLKERRRYRMKILSALSRNYEILESLLREDRTSAPLSELEKAGFDPAFVTGHRKGSFRHDDYACFDISFYRSDTKIFNLRRRSVIGL